MTPQTKIQNLADALSHEARLAAYWTGSSQEGRQSASERLTHHNAVMANIIQQLSELQKELL